MAHEVFISHSAKDKAVADALCASLEAAGIRCWVAPRDVQPGMHYAGQIKRAISDSSIFVLIFSAQANLSAHVLREVELAAKAGRHILSFRLEDTKVSDDLDYYLSIPHWLEAITPPLEKHLETLQRSVHALLGTLSPAPSAPEPEGELICPACQRETLSVQRPGLHRCPGCGFEDEFTFENGEILFDPDKVRKFLENDTEIRFETDCPWCGETLDVPPCADIECPECGCEFEYDPMEERCLWTEEPIEVECPKCLAGTILVQDSKSYQCAECRRYTEFTREGSSVLYDE